MPRYPESFKEAAVAKLCGPNAPTAVSLAAQLGVTDRTLLNWKKSYAKRGQVDQNRDSKRPQDWGLEDRLRAVLEAEKLTGQKLCVFHKAGDCTVST